MNDVKISAAAQFPKDKSLQQKRSLSLQTLMTEAVNINSSRHRISQIFVCTEADYSLSDIQTFKLSEEWRSLLVKVRREYYLDK